MTAYRPQTNGLTDERCAGWCNPKDGYEEPLDWDVHIPAVLYAYRTKAHIMLKDSALLSARSTCIPKH